jgi:ubiquinol-cytochrome c reductase iron-sulfur subunit
MTDNKDTDGGPRPEPTGTEGTDGTAEAEERTPRRVIGTPSPAESRRLLATDKGGDASPASPRPGEELDEAAARKAERVVATLFIITFLASVGFIVVYVLSGRNGGMHGVRRAMWSNYGLGTTMTIAFLAMAAGITIWFRRLMTAKPIIQERGDLISDAESRQAFTQNFMQGATDSGVTRRPLLRRTLLLAAAPLGLAPLVLLRDLGPLPEDKLRHTKWAKGKRLMNYNTGGALRPEDIAVGSLTFAMPEGMQESDHDFQTQIAKAALMLVRLQPENIKDRRELDWSHDGIVAFSKICTHVGCPINLYEQQTHHVLCPCHQSTFDLSDGARVIFGPAGHPLPQLQITVDHDGYLAAMGDFTQPVGPAFWERG